MQLENNYKTNQLTTHALNMIQRNQTLNDIREKLKKLSSHIDDESKVPFSGILKKDFPNAKDRKRVGTV
jgi:5-methylcytosine-specific restriction endonuclease McrBC regulatory subunit McrC